MNRFLSQLLASRERWIDAAGYRLKLRRPAEASLAAQAGKTERELMDWCTGHAVVDWELREEDVLPGVGGDARVPFDQDLYREWVADHMEVASAVAMATLALVKEHSEKEAAAQGN